jgi:hypothetical protein
MVRREQMVGAILSLIPGFTKERLRKVCGIKKIFKRRKSEEDEEEGYEFDEHGDDFLHGDDAIELEKMLWQVFERTVEKEEMKKRGGKEVPEKEMRKIMPTDAFSLRLFNNHRRLTKELSSQEIKTVRVVDIKHVTGLRTAQSNLLLIRVHEEFNSDVDPEKLRNRLCRIATAKCNQHVYSLLGRSIDFNIALKNYIKSVEEHTDKLTAMGEENRDQFNEQTTMLSEVAEIYSEAKKLERQDGPAPDEGGGDPLRGGLL